MSSPLFSTQGSAELTLDVFDNALFKDLIEQIDWREEEIVLFGKKVKVPRLVAYYGEFPYEYSSTKHPARPLPQILQAIVARTSAQSGFEYNAVLCNLYRDGNDSMGWHRDNEREIDQGSIASISFGETRKFKFRNRITKEVVDVLLPSGSLLLMNDCQQHWEHSLPKSKQFCGQRVNLTLRKVRRIDQA